MVGQMCSKSIKTREGFITFPTQIQTTNITITPVSLQLVVWKPGGLEVRGWFPICPLEEPGILIHETPKSTWGYPDMLTGFVQALATPFARHTRSVISWWTLCWMARESKLSGAVRPRFVVPRFALLQLGRTQHLMIVGLWLP